ncbi:MAG: sugar ABC transporter substrate-binding protein, partial [Fretibacterium sp.]|nr:sugar ABC transporter substrate-binding protein [Fretibacterium sp.]
MKKLGIPLLVLTLALFSFAGVAVAEEFNWKQCEGQTIKILFNQHPYAEGIIQKIPEFEALTGIKVVHTMIPEENYFDKLT